jgi:transaldolase
MSASPISQFEALSKVTTIVADTGDIASIKKYSPTDATTNPSLVYKAALIPEYAGIVANAIQYAKAKGGSEEAILALSLDKLSVDIGVEISKIVPGYVSTEVDARLSFSTQATIDKARSLIALYAEAGVDKSRILVKIASTWEGIKAAEVLQAEGITCNLTLLFSMCQAVACADAKCTLISPFVGRIMDWYKSKEKVSGYEASEDPGVLSVSQIYNYYKKFGHETIVMGASFRNKGEIIELAGCDRLTIAPALLEELSNSTEAVPLKLDEALSASRYDGEELKIDEATFRWMLNEDAMATEKLGEGIRNFAADLRKLEEVIKAKM